MRPVVLRAVLLTAILMATSGCAQFGLMRTDVFSNVYRRAQDSVVEIREAKGSHASGFVWREDGYILTAGHVVAGFDTVEVYFSDSQHYTARVVGSDQEVDIAVLKIDHIRPLRPLPLGHSRHLRPGDQVLSAGFPFGLGAAVSMGVISATLRNLKGIQPLLQTDAAINYGNSGGPLLGIDGAVVGVVISIYRGNSVAFAVPIDEVLRVARILRKGQKVRYAWTGIHYIRLSDIFSEEQAKRSEIPWPLPQAQGIYITKVVPGSPAEKAGIRVQDIIVSLNGVRVGEDMYSFGSQLAQSPIGVQIPIVVKRSGVDTIILITLGEREPIVEYPQGN